MSKEHQLSIAHLHRISTQCKRPSTILDNLRFIERSKSALSSIHIFSSRWNTPAKRSISKPLGKDKSATFSTDSLGRDTGRTPSSVILTLPQLNNVYNQLCCFSVYDTTTHSNPPYLPQPSEPMSNTMRKQPPFQRLDSQTNTILRHAEQNNNAVFEDTSKRTQPMTHPITSRHQYKSSNASAFDLTSIKPT